jgi:hypothetical protein
VNDLIDFNESLDKKVLIKKGKQILLFVSSRKDYFISNHQIYRNIKISKLKKQ